MIVSHIACIRQKERNAHHLIRKSEGQGILGRLTHRWEDNIKMCFKKAELTMSFVVSLIM